MVLDDQCLHSFPLMNFESSQFLVLRLLVNIHLKLTSFYELAGHENALARMHSNELLHGQLFLPYVSFSDVVKQFSNIHVC